MTAATIEEEKCPAAGEGEADRDDVDDAADGEALSPEEGAREAQFRELEEIDANAREGYANGKYHYAYGEYKRGLRSCSDLVAGRAAREDPDLEARYRKMRRKFCVNAAAACIKVNHWQQGLEACALLLEEGADSEAQRRKALYRSGVCARGMGELKAAKNFLDALLEIPDLDEASRRDTVRELRRVKEEKKRYKQFAKNIVSKKNEDSIIWPSKKAEPTPEELQKMADDEERRNDYIELKKSQEAARDTKLRPTPAPDISLTEEEAVDALDVLIKRYSDGKVQEDLKQAAMDHGLTFGKGFILKSRMILVPLQRDLLVKHGFLDPSDVDGDGKSKEERQKAHAAALAKFQHAVRFLGQSHGEIKEKATTCQRLAMSLLWEESMGA